MFVWVQGAVSGGGGETWSNTVLMTIDKCQATKKFFDLNQLNDLTHKYLILFMILT